jgi:peptide/nickel transport system substrate-binding protein
MNIYVRRLRGGALGLAILSAPLAQALAETPDDQIVIGMSMINILALDPPFQSGRESLEVISNVYDALLQTDPVEKGKLLPGLAESWTLSEDGSTVTFKLRKGVKFHSRNPLTAKDFVFSITRAFKADATQAAKWKDYGFNKDNVAQAITAPDDYTVLIKIPEKTDPVLLLYTVANTCAGMVLDSKLVMENEKDGDMGQAWLAANDAGSGPFSLRSWQPNNLIMLERFDDYWQGPAEMRRIVYRHMPEPQTQRLSIEKGDIDIAMNLAVADIKALEGNEDVAVQSTPGGNIYYLAASMKDERFAKREVRLALRHLIDYDGINKTIMPFYGIYHQRPIQNGVLGALPDPGYKLDVEKAKEYLAKAGYPDGFSTTLRVLSDPPFIDAATSIQATLAQAGIKADIVSGNGDAVYGAMRDRKFELVVGRGGGGTDPHPHSNLRSQLYNPDNRDEAKLTSFQGWRTSFVDQKMNEMIDDALLEKDKDKQKKKYEDIQLYTEEVVPSMQPFSQAVDTVVLRADVKNYHYHYAWTTHFRGVTKER